MLTQTFYWLLVITAFGLNTCWFLWPAINRLFWPLQTVIIVVTCFAVIVVAWSFQAWVIKKTVPQAPELKNRED